MLHLHSETPPAWVAESEADLPSLLLDHAHCEKKAASTAINLVFRYGDDVRLARVLSDLAREELEHFQLLLDVLEARGIRYGRLEPSPYAPGLLSACRSKEPGRRVDTLLCCALIEARSCERMKALSEHLRDPELRTLYADLLASEARHFRTYVDLARAVAPEEDVAARLRVLAAHEADVLRAPPGPPPPVRMHAAVVEDPAAAALSSRASSAGRAP